MSRFTNIDERYSVFPKPLGFATAIAGTSVGRYKRQLSLHWHLHCRMSVENETPQEG